MIYPQEHNEIFSFLFPKKLVIPGDCKWKGRAGDWMDHCFMEHSEKVTELPFITVKNRWDAKRTEPVLNYFLLKCYDRIFNVYQIYDKRGGKNIIVIKYRILLLDFRDGTCLL